MNLRRREKYAKTVLYFLILRHVRNNAMSDGWEFGIPKLKMFRYDAEKEKNFSDPDKSGRKVSNCKNIIFAWNFTFVCVHAGSSSNMLYLIYQNWLKSYHVIVL